MTGKPSTPPVRRDCKCPTVTHQHGTIRAYRADRCRCTPCRAARAAESQAHVRSKAYRRWNPVLTSVPIHCTRRRVEALICQGWSVPQIAAEAGMCGALLRRQIWADLRWVTPRNAAKIAAAYERLWDRPPPSATRTQRQTATRMRNFAVRKGFAPPMAWDNIDDPDAVPDVTGPSMRGVDEVLVARIVGGLTRLPRYDQAHREELLEAVRQLVALGMSDRQIGARVGRSQDAVVKMRSRHGVPSGVPRCGTAA